MVPAGGGLVAPPAGGPAQGEGQPGAGDDPGGVLRGKASQPDGLGDRQLDESDSAGARLAAAGGQSQAPARRRGGSPGQRRQRDRRRCHPRQGRHPGRRGRGEGLSRRAGRRRADPRRQRGRQSHNAQTPPLSVKPRLYYSSARLYGGTDSAGCFWSVGACFVRHGGSFPAWPRGKTGWPAGQRVPTAAGLRAAGRRACRCDSAGSGVQARRLAGLLRPTQEQHKSGSRRHPTRG